MENKVYLYPGWVRFWHWMNAVLCLLLILTGLSMQYSSGKAPWIDFSSAVSIHNVSGIILTINYLIFFIGNLVTKNGKYYRIPLKGMIKRLIKQFTFYAFGIFKGDSCPYPVNEKRKFNPLQKFSYVVIMYICVPIVILSGWLLFFPELIPASILGFGGVLFNAMLHIIMGFIISLFLVVHIYFCTIGATPLSNFKSMINGWHEARH